MMKRRSGGRHRDVRVLERYDDSREDLAGQLARRLAEDAG
jgi:hypothetical protein